MSREWEFGRRLVLLFADSHRYRYSGCKPAMSDILCGKATTGQSVLHPRTASGPALVTFGDRADCFGVVMPIRRKPDMQAVQIRNTVLAG